LGSKYPSIRHQADVENRPSVLGRAFQLSEVQLAFELRTHDDWHQAVAETDALGRREGQVCEVQRPQALRDVISASPLAASAQTDLTLPTRCCHAAITSE